MATNRASVAKHEIAAITDMYNRMLKQCFEKCVENFHDNDLSLGESTCIDRCVMKYGECQVKVGETMAKVSNQMNGQGS